MASFGTRMKLGMHCPKTRCIDVRVTLGGGQIRMPQKFLDTAKIRTTRDQMRGKTVAQ